MQQIYEERHTDFHMLCAMFEPTCSPGVGIIAFELAGQVSSRSGSTLDLGIL